MISSFSKRRRLNKKRKYADNEVKQEVTKQVIKVIKRQAEKMNIDTGENNVESVNTGTVTHCTAIAQGDADPGRTGNQIEVTSVYVRVKVYHSGAAPAAAQFIRFALVVDRQQVADSPPTVANIWNGAAMIQPLQDQSLGRYQILLDEVIPITVESPGFFKKYIDFKKPIKVRFNGAASSDIQKNGFYFVHFSESATPDAPKLSWFVRTKATDL